MFPCSQRFFRNCRKSATSSGHSCRLYPTKGRRDYITAARERLCASWQRESVSRRHERLCLSYGSGRAYHGGTSDSISIMPRGQTVSRWQESLHVHRGSKTAARDRVLGGLWSCPGWVCGHLLGLRSLSGSWSVVCPGGFCGHVRSVVIFWVCDHFLDRGLWSCPGWVFGHFLGL